MSMSFTVSDLVLAAFIALSLIGGWRAGTVRVLSRFAAVFIAYGVARYCSGWLAWLLQGMLPRLTPATEAGEKLLQLLYLFCDVDGLIARLLGLAAFIAVFLVSLWLVKKLANAVSGVFGRGLLGRLNQLLGALLALAIACAAILLFSDIFFPVFAQMGAEGPKAFMENSRFVVPGLHRLLLLI